MFANDPERSANFNEYLYQVRSKCLIFGYQEPPFNFVFTQFMEDRTVLEAFDLWRWSRSPKEPQLNFDVPLIFCDLKPR